VDDLHEGAVDPCEHVEVFRPVEEPRVLRRLRKEHLPSHQIALALGLAGHGLEHRRVLHAREPRLHRHRDEVVIVHTGEREYALVAGLIAGDGYAFDLAVLHENRLRTLHVGREGALLAGYVNRVAETGPPQHDGVQDLRTVPDLGRIRQDVALRLEVEHLPRLQAAGILKFK
jgi:hypothetical protein